MNDVNAISEEAVILNSTGTVDVNGGDFKTTGTKSCFVNNSANLTINKGSTTEGNFVSEGASCINNSWGQVRINGGSFTTDAGIAVKNCGGLRLNGGTVEAPNGTAIDISGESGDVQLNGGTIRNSVTGVRVADAGDSEIDLKAVTFENNTDDISLGKDQQINIKKSFAGTAKIRVDDPARGRQITTDNEDLSYQKKLKLFSMNPGYIIGYKHGDDGVEYRYLADANGNIVTTENAKATANLGAGEQELDTATVVPEHTTVTVTANLPEGAEFLGWSAVRDDGKALDWTPARDDPQTITFTMPDCNVTVEALYQSGNGDIDNPSGGGSSNVVAGIAAVALTGAAVWGIYETGTGIYRVLNMPDVPMPSNRAGLATLIWEKAGCPEPQTVKSFSDIDDADLHLRQAASWMEEQGLMDDVKENEFRPYRYVTKLQTCLVWDKAKEKSLIS
ncbi:MAG: InlB B-repeat-containing protein [Faecalibacterium sp.]